MPDPSVFPAYPREDFEFHREAITEAVESVLESGWYILGPEVEKFELEFSAFVQSAHTVGVANGTDAIELLLRAHRIGEGDQVIVPSHTAVATASAVSRTGAVPLFADVDPERFTLSPQGLDRAIAQSDAKKLKAVIAVHLYGQPADLDELQAICRSAGILLFEDCAQAHGATLGGQHVGSLADGGSFSFYPTKNLGAIGDGGAVTVNDPKVAETLKELRQYGWRQRYVSELEGGINSRLDELQAAVLRAKLPGLPDQIRHRRELARLYRAKLDAVSDVRLPVQVPGSEHAFHLFVIRVPDRNRLLKHLEDRGIPVALHYPAAVHQQPAYAASASLSPALPETESAIREILTLPLHSVLPEEGVRQTAAAIREFFAA